MSRKLSSAELFDDVEEDADFQTGIYASLKMAHGDEVVSLMSWNVLARHYTIHNAQFHCSKTFTKRSQIVLVFVAIGIARSCDNGTPL